MQIRYLILKIQNSLVDVFKLNEIGISCKSSKKTCIARSMIESKFIILEKVKEKVQRL